MVNKKQENDIDLKEQVALLQAKLDALESRPSNMPNSSLMQEMAKLKKHQVRSAAQVPYRIIDDHKNVFLYQGNNHRIGPLHPNNAMEAMIRFAEKGIQLYTEPRTPEQVEEFKKSKQWTDFVKKNKDERAKYKKQNIAEAFTKAAEVIARETGKSMSEMNAITAVKP